MESYSQRTVLSQLSLRNLAQAARVQWSWSHTSSLLVGAALAWKDGLFNPGLLFLTWFCVELIHAGTCMTNDYWDYKSGADNVGEHTMFNAGSRVIQEGKISPSLLFILSYVCYGLAGAVGIYLAVMRGWPLIVLGVTGAALGYLYTAPPAQLAYRGFDQLTVALCYGPLTVLTTYYIQAQTLTAETWIVGMVYAITASMIVYVKGFQDTEFDRRAQKESIIIKLGQRRGAALFIYFYIAAYVLIAIGIILQILPVWTLIGAGSILLTLRARNALHEHLATGTAKSFFTLLMRTKSVHFYLGLLLIIGYTLAGVVPRLSR